jgi:hypothetical protein
MVQNGFFKTLHHLKNEEKYDQLFCAEVLVAQKQMYYTQNEDVLLEMIAAVSDDNDEELNILWLA